MSAGAPSHRFRLTARSEVAERTLELRFDRPPTLAFEAGQWMDLSLVDPPETDAEGDTRAFSIASAPDDPELWFVTRLRNTAFKRVLEKLPLGSVVKADGPFGSLTLPGDASRAAVLLAGGIGITPFRSIARSAAHAKAPHRILLFYANRRPEDAPFLDELRALERANPNLTFVPTMTQPDRSHRPWMGETGRLDVATIARHLGHDAAAARHGAGPIYSIAGPPSMVAGLRRMLIQGGVDPDDVRSEEFSGY